MLQALIDKSQERVNGTVRLKLYKGNVIVEGRKSPDSLYSMEHVTFAEDTVYDQRDAEGFIKLNALRLRLLNRQKRSRPIPAGRCWRRQPAGRSWLRPSPPSRPGRTPPPKPGQWCPCSPSWA